MKYYLIVGEASGDLHASRLMRSLKNVDEFAEFRFFGGDLMAAEGGLVSSIIRSWPIWDSFLYSCILALFSPI